MNNYQLALLCGYTIVVFGLGVFRGMRLQQELDRDRK